jgi:bifunctional non-homologous end joining protein LigD
LKSGKITFTLFGQKLKGRFSLIKTGRVGGESNHWLLINANDEFATEDPVDKPKSVLTGKTNAELEHKGPKRIHSKEVEQKTNNAEVQFNKAIGKDYITGTETQQRFPTIVKPMLGALVDKPFDNKDWAFEIKWDGVRAILFFSK